MNLQDAIAIVLTAQMDEYPEWRGEDSQAVIEEAKRVIRGHGNRMICEGARRRMNDDG